MMMLTSFVRQVWSFSPPGDDLHPQQLSSRSETPLSMPDESSSHRQVEGVVEDEFPDARRSLLVNENDRTPDADADVEGGVGVGVGGGGDVQMGD